LNTSEIEEVIEQLKLGKVYEYSSEPDPDPYGGGGYDITTVSYNKVSNNYLLIINSWASQYNAEPDVLKHIFTEEKIKLSLFAVHRNRVREV